MPSLPAHQLIKAIQDAAQESGGTAFLLSAPTHHPRKFVVQAAGDSFELWVYGWTLTHGGGWARPKDEYRIQMTSVTPPLAINTTGPTVLIGYEPNLSCFAGFNIRKHMNFTAGSPSIQININTLHRALQDGLSFATKGNDEIAIGFRPDQFIAYVQHATNLHIHGTSAKIAEMLTKAASLQSIPSEQIKVLPKERQRIVGTVSRLSRDANFRQKIITAYDRRCAGTRMQLRLIDAAHILPVEAPGSNDDVTNGVCLSPTYHRAYDRGLIYLDDSLSMRINPDYEAELAKLHLAGGIASFKGHLDKRIHLPPDKHQWPDVGMVRKANKVRGIPN